LTTQYLPLATNAWPGIRGIKFALAELGNDAGIYGAARIALDK